MNRQMSAGVDNTIEVDGQKVCSNCGKCCSAILCVSKQELSKIRKYLRKHPEIKLTNHNNVLDKEFKDICPFLTEENKCSIYEIRPEICRHFLCTNFKSTSVEPMDHRDKSVVNMITEFMPDSPCPSAPNLKQINEFYEEKKKLAYGGKN